MNYQKLALALFLSLAIVLLMGIGYAIDNNTSVEKGSPRSILQECTVVKIHEVGGHEYVVATCFHGSIEGGAGISVLHHVGCKACKGQAK